MTALDLLFSQVLPGGGDREVENNVLHACMHLILRAMKRQHIWSVISPNKFGHEKRQIRPPSPL